MAFKKGLWRKLKFYRIYIRTELAQVLGINICSVSNWVNKHGLRPINPGKKILLFEGKDVIEFLKQWEVTRKVHLQHNEYYCLRCKTAVLANPDSIKLRYTGKFNRDRSEKIMQIARCRRCKGKICRIISTKNTKNESTDKKN